jgi:diguanylate cyclase (GGDEF)-like protein
LRERLQKRHGAGTLYTMAKVHKVLIITEDRELTTVMDFCFDGWGYEVFFEESKKADISRIVRIAPDIVVVDAHSADKDRLEICDILKTDLSTAYIPVIVLMDKRQLRRELLKLQQGVDDYLIKPPDPLELRIRIEMALKRSQHSFYANPLTGLPGGIIIEDELTRRLGSGKDFAAGQVDIDNFKSFNDRYGYIQGDRVIMQAAYMLNTAVKRWGNRDDFIGHIGGDDFVLITTPEKYNELCKNFVCMFDTITRFHYSPEDRASGYIVAKDRSNRIKKTPLMSVTIALVLKNSPEEINSLIELNERIAEVKQYLKKIPGSKYMADRRIMKKNDHLQVQIFTNDESITDGYKPLGQILLERNLITPAQLDEALKVHWKRGELLGEVLKEMGFVSGETLAGALSAQEDELESSKIKTEADAFFPDTFKISE